MQITVTVSLSEWQERQLVERVAGTTGMPVDDVYDHLQEWLQATLIEDLHVLEFSEAEQEEFAVFVRGKKGQRPRWAGPLARV